MAAAGFGFTEEIEHHSGGVDGRERLMTFSPVYLGALPPIGSNIARAFGIDVAAGGDAQTALNHRGQVGDDVAEQVVG